MTREATCFSCRHVLRVAPDAQGRWLTCPRCLASVGNPFVLLPAEPAPTGAPPPAPASAQVQPQRPEPTSEAMTCSSCGREVDPAWRICPYCEHSVRRVRPEPGGASLDAEVGRDSRGTNFVAIALGALLILGVVLFVLIGGPMMVQSGTDPGQVLLVGLLAIGAFVAGVIVLAVGARHQAITAVSGVLGGLVIGAGVVLLVVLVACMTIAAAFTNFMHTCGCK